MKEQYKQSIGNDGDTRFENVPSYGNSLEILKEMNYEVVDCRVQPIMERDYFTKELKSKGYIHVHFFNPKGTEIAYWTAFVNILTIFKTPRVWDKSIFNASVYP